MEILEVCKVSPPPGSVSDICLPLSFFDLIWLRLPPIEMLFFFEHPCNSETFFSSIVPKLKKSLSISLQMFLPLSGNLVWPPSAPNPTIRYKIGDAVLLTVAQSNADFHHLSSSNFRETKSFHPLIPEILGLDFIVPIFTVKITFFPEKGFCIGIVRHHTVSDGAASIEFLKFWALVSKFGESRILKPETVPIFDKTSLRKMYPQLETLFIDELLKQNTLYPKSLTIMRVESLANGIRGTFQLSDSDIKKLIGFVRGKANQELHTSVFTVTYAYLIICLAKAKRITAKKVFFSVIVDHRHRLIPLQPANYFGNCIGFYGGDVSVEDLLREDGIMYVVDSIDRAIKSSDDGFLEKAKKWVISDTTTTFEEGEKVMTLAGSPRLDYYNLDFGWGKPRKVDISSIDKTGAMSLVMGRDGEGIEIELSLDKNQMLNFAHEFSNGLSSLSPKLSAL